MAEAEVHLADGAVDRYDFGAHPMTLTHEPEPQEMWSICHTVTPEGALLIGTARTYVTLARDPVTAPFKYFTAKVTYAPGRWVKVIGGKPIREE